MMGRLRHAEGSADKNALSIRSLWNVTEDLRFERWGK